MSPKRKSKHNRKITYGCTRFRGSVFHSGTTSDASMAFSRAATISGYACSCTVAGEAGGVVLVVVVAVLAALTLSTVEDCRDDDDDDDEILAAAEYRAAGLKAEADGPARTVAATTVAARNFIVKLVWIVDDT